MYFQWAVDIIMFSVNTVRDSLLKGLYSERNVIFLMYFQWGLRLKTL